ncbi:flagellar protein FliT [Dyella caseinilytica]|uniref:Flagellar protein FliT n=1 Tax=Dyella caseinilytica TaxID=1849581 RepID=A0ABX7GSJ1_9GAMM|nr:flagellar protein FliT [Dyella caseinilytica]QRN53407.1 flagellar protein FliT [Dyella caseinilytica]GFZ86285.1 hypothetical protein GCM10011408_00780 [Dyella caseinilytica]
MNEAARADLQQALQITVEMLDAATGNNWDWVSQLDAERHRELQKCKGSPLSDRDRQIIATLRRHNETLMAHAEAARAALKAQLDQHQYNHRALRTYISSST